MGDPEFDEVSEEVFAASILAYANRIGCNLISEGDHLAGKMFVKDPRTVYGGPCYRDRPDVVAYIDHEDPEKKFFVRRAPRTS